MYIDNLFLLNIFCRALDKEKSLSQRKVTVTEPLSSVLPDNSMLLLCQVSAGLTLSKEGSSGLLCQILYRLPRQRKHQLTPLRGLLPSSLGGTRQRVLLCRVPEPHH
jgi:hypothetical protein